MLHRFLGKINVLLPSWIKPSISEKSKAKAGRRELVYQHD